jgi:hypothetical protein
MKYKRENTKQKIQNRKENRKRLTGHSSPEPAQEQSQTTPAQPSQAHA